MALAWAQARGIEEPCPPTLDATELRVTTSDSPIEIVHLGGDRYELRSPSLRVRPTWARPVATLVCPAATAGWFDDEGQLVETEPTLAEPTVAEPAAPAE